MDPDLMGVIVCVVQSTYLHDYQVLHYDYHFGFSLSGKMLYTN